MKKMYTLAVFALLAGGLTAQEIANAGATTEKPAKTPAAHTLTAKLTAKLAPDLAPKLLSNLAPKMAPKMVSNFAGLPPEWTSPIPNTENSADAPNKVIDLSTHFNDPNDPPSQLSFSILHNAFPEVAEVTVSGQSLTIDYIAAGQTTIIVQVSNGGLATTDTFAIGVRPDITGTPGEDIEIASFDDLTLAQDSYWNGSDESGSFTSGPATFYNSYNPDWFAWYGWAYSSMSDDTTSGYANQYSAFSRVRIDSAQGKNYAVAYASPWSDVELDPHSDQEVKGFFVTNSTWAALSMKHGDAFSKKFGGPDGTDPDYLKLTITGTDTDWNTDTVEYYLADFTDPDPAKDYIIETWQWVDLTPLGKVRQLQFTMSSTDNGDWGMNTPAYFCMDNLVVLPDAEPVVHQVEDITDEPGKTIALALNDIFTDPDDPDDSIEIYLAPGSWNTLVVDPHLGEDSLRIDLLDTGESDLSLAAVSNGKMVTGMFHISVMLTGTGRPAAYNYSGMHGEQARFSVYPNPTSGQFRIDTQTGYKAATQSENHGYSLTGDHNPRHTGHPAISGGQLTIIDPSGRIIREIPAYVPGTPVNISNSPAGVYLLKYELENEISVVRIIKK